MRGSDDTTLLNFYKYSDTSSKLLVDKVEKWYTTSKLNSNKNKT